MGRADRLEVTHFPTSSAELGSTVAHARVSPVLARAPFLVGLGINLHTADTVIHYDTDWNPQAGTSAHVPLVSACSDIAPVFFWPSKYARLKFFGQAVCS